MRGALTAVVLAALVLGAGLTASAPVAGAQVTGERPNILLIVSDDQRAGTLDSMPRTSAIFGGGGTTYENAYATTPLCCPSRASILTGRYAHNHGVTDNDPEADLLDHATAMPALLQSLGYRTMVAGKLSNPWAYDEQPPFFEDSRIGFPPEFGSEEDYLSAAARQMLAATEAADAQPWFLWLGARAPHTPLIPDPEYANARVPVHLTPGQGEADLSDKPSYVQKAIREETRTANEEFQFTEVGEQIRYELQSRRELLSLDDMIAEVFAALEAAGEADDTIAFFVSDNGYLAGEHGGLARKHLPYMEAIHVPMMVRWPGRIAAGVSLNRLVANIDIAPTIYDALGATPPVVPDGRSLLAGHRRPSLLTERLVGGNWPAWSGLVTRRWHYIENLKPGGTEARTEELYDLRSDPYELRNVLKAEEPPPPELVEELRTALADSRGCSGASCP